MKRTISLFLLIPVILICVGTDECNDNSDRKDREAVQSQQAQYQAKQPIPSFDYSLERDVAIQLYEARNEKVATWTVWRGDMSIIEGDCPSIGYPLPYDTSLTNPLAPYNEYAASGTVVEQPEPNGLFASHNSIATWVRCVVTVNGKRITAPVYIEGKVTAYPYPVQVDYEANRVKPVQGAKPSVALAEAPLP